MKYYIVSLCESEVHAPVISDWYKTVPVASFFRDRTWEIPFRNLLQVKDCGWEPHYPRLLFSPLPLVHESMMNIFRAYGLDYIEKQMIFLDAVHKKSELYYLIQLTQIHDRVRQEDGKYFIVSRKRELIDLDAFYIVDMQKCELVCSLALLESMIRQGLSGIQLRPLEIRGEE